jgi:hypothetical protein
MPLRGSFQVGQLIASDPELFAQYDSLGKRSINDDMDLIVQLDLAVPLEDDRFQAKTIALQAMKSRLRR